MQLKTAETSPVNRSVRAPVALAKYSSTRSTMIFK